MFGPDLGPISSDFGSGWCATPVTMVHGDGDAIVVVWTQLQTGLLAGRWSGLLPSRGVWFHTGLLVAGCSVRESKYRVRYGVHPDPISYVH